MKLAFPVKINFVNLSASAIPLDTDVTTPPLTNPSSNVDSTLGPHLSPISFIMNGALLWYWSSSSKLYGNLSGNV